MRKALLGTVRSQIVVQVEPDDARLLVRSFGPTLTELDLRSLPAHEIAARLSIDGQTSRPMTGQTRPLPDSLGSGNQVRALSSSRYGTPRSEVEAGLARRGQVPTSQQPLGERPTERRPR